MSFWTCRWDETVSLIRLVYDTKKLVLGLLCWSVGLSGIRFKEFALCVCVCLFLKQHGIVKQHDNYKYEVCALLGCYVVLIGSFWCSGTTNWFHLQSWDWKKNVSDCHCRGHKVSLILRVHGGTAVQWPVRMACLAVAAGHIWTDTFCMLGEKLQ
jgi:hypothetical protein